MAKGPLKRLFRKDAIKCPGCKRSFDPDSSYNKMEVMVSGRCPKCQKIKLKEDRRGRRRKRIKKFLQRKKSQAEAVKWRRKKAEENRPNREELEKIIKQGTLSISSPEKKEDMTASEARLKYWDRVTRLSEIHSQ